MTNLITATEFATYRNISQKLDDGKIDEAIALAQQSDLVEILGDFYFDVIKNAADPAYADLMNGSEFTYCDEDFEHAGIKKLLADYTYARFIYMANVNLTPFGAQKKFTQDSEGIERNHIKDLAKQAQIDAGNKFKFIEYYILSDPTTFARYCKNKSQGTGFFSYKTSKL